MNKKLALITGSAAGLLYTVALFISWGARGRWFESSLPDFARRSFSEGGLFYFQSFLLPGGLHRAKPDLTKRLKIYHFLWKRFSTVFFRLTHDNDWCKKNHLNIFV